MGKAWFLAAGAAARHFGHKSTNSSVEESLMDGFIAEEAVREMGNMWGHWATRGHTSEGVISCLPQSLCLLSDIRFHHGLPAVTSPHMGSEALESNDHEWQPPNL